MNAANMEEPKNYNGIVIELTKVQVELKGIDKKVDELNRFSNLLQVVEQSSKSAHNRLDKVESNMDSLKIELLEKMKVQDTEYEKDLLNMQKNFDKEIANIRRDYDKEMLAQDKKWGDRLEPFVSRQKKFETAFITSGVGLALSGIIFLIKFFG